MEKDNKIRRGPAQIIGDIEETKKVLKTTEKAHKAAARWVVTSGGGHNDEAFDLWTSIKALKQNLIEYQLELEAIEKEL